MKATAFSTTVFPFVKLRRRHNAKEGGKQNACSILRPFWYCDEGYEQLVKGTFFGSFLWWQRNEQETYLNALEMPPRWSA